VPAAAPPVLAAELMLDAGRCGGGTVVIRDDLQSTYMETKI
jgi:hypothetical protein